MTLKKRRYAAAVFIFRRDLRLADNTGLNRALEQSRQVIPCFVFDPVQIEDHPYRSGPGLQFMLQSIQDLEKQFDRIGARLNLLHGPPEKTVEALCASFSAEAVFINRDYTPFSRNRDDRLRDCCHRFDVDFHVLDDALLTTPEQMLKENGTPYKVFTAFHHRAGLLPVALPAPLAPGQFHPGLPEAMQHCYRSLLDDAINPSIQPGGRTEACALLDTLDDFGEYQNRRDFPALDGTTRLSPHLKFGTCSAREAFHAAQSLLGPEHALIRELYWRDFFTHIGFHFPRVFGHAFQEKYDAITWPNRRDLFQAWTEGKTGFPIVDAGMRQLNRTGFMHNRVRMIAASFLVKDLHVDWRWGERYFARHLTDYDPCVNNGNWQWAASTGCDAQPYFRIFNPWLQQQKFDPECRYITRWLPELENVPVSVIHRWDKKNFACGYPKPVVDHKIESSRSKELFKNCRPVAG
ncbi:MAG: cryptochrome/photolyase family protein [Gammaproteobacteria bacterium]